MGFETPSALWGLLALLPLLALSFWKFRPPRVAVPSIALWRGIPDRVPPVRALRRPRVTAGLLLQMAAVGAGVVALAAPFREETSTRPRNVAVVIDCSARMLPRVEAVRREFEALRRALGPSDRIVAYPFPDLRRTTGEPALEIAHRAGDPHDALELAAAERPDLLFYIGDRPVRAACEQILVGGPMQNSGVVAASIHEGKVYARKVGPEGERTVEFEPREEIAIASDAFGLDDVIYLQRRRGEVSVALHGAASHELRRALESLPGVRLVAEGAADVVIRVAQAAGPDDPPSRVLVEPPDASAAFVPGRVSFPEEHPLWRSVVGDQVRLRDAREARGGTPVLFADGRPIASIQDRELRLAFSWAPAERGGWPAYPSFPIFWANVIEFFAPGAREGWAIHRTGETVKLMNGRTVRLTRVGPQRFDGETVSANLLDRESSDLSGEARPFVPARIPPAPTVPLRRDASVWPAAAALAFVLLSWWAERSR